MNRPMKTRRFKKADCELDFFFISGVWARARVIRYVVAALAKAFPAGEFISEKRGCAIWIWVTRGSVAKWMIIWSSYIPPIAHRPPPPSLLREKLGKL